MGTQNLLPSNQMSNTVIILLEFAREAREQNTGLWAYGENGTTRGDLD